MRGRVFVDTNILLYALTEPKDKNRKKDLLKRAKALELLTKLYNEDNIVVSVQVLNELHFNMVRKFELDDNMVFETLQENVFAIASVEGLTVQVYMRAFKVREKYNISYWDSLVVSSALESGCTQLYSEDMQEGLIVDGTLRIINPFL